LHGRVVPGVAGHGLVMPDVFAGVGTHRDDRAEEQVVAATRAAQCARPGRAVADTYIQEIELGVVSEGIPGSATATLRPPLAGPGLGRHLHRVTFEAFGRVAGDGVETPDEFAGCGVVGRDVSAHAVFGAAVTDDDLVLDDARRTGDRIAVARIRRPSFPREFAGGGVECDQAPVERAGVDAALPHGGAAVLHAAAGLRIPFRRHLRIVLPQQLAGRGIDGLHLAPGAGGIHDAVDDDRCRLLAA
jgi:hypothetical protein